MSPHPSLAILLPISLPVVCGLACSSSGSETDSSDPHIVTVAQSGRADVIGSDSRALQRAADMLISGDILEIGPGNWQMDDALYIRVDNVTVRGKECAEKTVLAKGPGVESALVSDAGYGISDLVVAEPEKFEVGMGVTIMDNRNRNGYSVSVSSIVGIDGDTLRIDPMTVMDYICSRHKGWVQNTFPILAGMDVSGLTFEGLTIDGNKDKNKDLNGCRGGGIYLFKAKNCLIKDCVVKNYGGDGISFQITENVKVTGCEVYGSSSLGIHPGTGSFKAEVTNCYSHDNGNDGLFLCWRVKHGRFTDNVLENNGRHGISIGHKDTDNYFENNKVIGNKIFGVYIRHETYDNSGHRKRMHIVHKVKRKLSPGANAQRRSDDHQQHGFYSCPAIPGMKRPVDSSIEESDDQRQQH